MAFDGSGSLKPPHNAANHEEHTVMGSIPAVFDSPTVSESISFSPSASTLGHSLPQAQSQNEGPLPLFRAIHPEEQWIRSHPCWRLQKSHVTFQDKRFGARVFKQELGLLSDLLGRKNCEACQIMYRQFERVLRRLEGFLPPGCVDWKNESEVICSIKLDIIATYVVNNVRTRNDHSYPMYNLPVGPFPKGGKLLDSSWISTEDVKEMISVCDSQHRECRSEVIQAPLPTNLFLIDVTDMCIVKLDGVPYLALSYVWGKIANFELRHSNLRELLEPRSLSHKWKALPQTIRDSILLTAKLGYRYLWVDSLCIEQDNEEHKLDQINQMAAIYENSEVTIVAADGTDSNHGLRGVGESPRIEFHQEILGLSPTAKIIINWNPEIDTSRKVYFGRGWTFQEFNLARRLLIFIDNRFIWRCLEYEPREYEHREEHVHGGITTCLQFDFLRGTMSWWPNLIPYMRIVAEYNSRNLSNDGDALSAFIGVLTAFNRRFPFGFLQALPELYFDIALLWQPHRPLRRRSSHDGQCCFPSWSWLGWHGDLDLKQYEFGIEDPRLDGAIQPQVPRREIFPVTQWYKSTLDFSKRIPIRNDYDSYRQLRLPGQRTNVQLNSSVYRPCASSSSLATDWYRSTCVYPEKYDGSSPAVQMPCWRSKSTEEAFSFPLPIGPGPTELQSPELRYLHFRSHRTRLFATNNPTQSFLDYPHCINVSLVDAAGEVVGLLRLNSMETPECPLEACELVAISKGIANLEKRYVSGDFDEPIDLVQLNAMTRLRFGPKVKLDKLKDDEISGNLMEWWHTTQSATQRIWEILGYYEYYNVLWIEWENGIAYRKALGRVYKEAWEAQELEEVDIVLG
ncbi:HET-domain-containing protein [Byssothecium circinans]|uniref:HET-domain-containing protein n=1 Tax=Byssothecium circinans TaxID=147558 RepID=A0A6A5UCV2_9PLEO|nr:HET-domain-containing protein [Byssothecium circinans]